MKVNIKDVEIKKIASGIEITHSDGFYILANCTGFDFKFKKSFSNHFLNNHNLKQVIKQEDGLVVITTTEPILDKYFTNVSLILDVKLDNITMLNLYRVVTETISSTLYECEIFNKDELNNVLGNFYNMIYIACCGKNDIEYAFDISLLYQIQELTKFALKESIKQLD